MTDSISLMIYETTVLWLERGTTTIYRNVKQKLEVFLKRVTV